MVCRNAACSCCNSGLVGVIRSYIRIKSSRTAVCRALCPISRSLAALESGWNGRAASRTIVFRTSLRLVADPASD